MALLAVLLFALAGCGGSSNSSSPTAASAPAARAKTAGSGGASTGAASSHVRLAAATNGQLSYNTKTLRAKAGKVSIDFVNMAAIMHNVTIEGPSSKQLGATPTFQGGAKTLTLDLQPGTYKFFCSVPGHRAAGMEGTLIVE